jgi:hypothetical protein
LGDGEDSEHNKNLNPDDSRVESMIRGFWISSDSGQLTALAYF